MIAERVAWSAEARAGLGKALGDDAQVIEAEVTAGRATLWKLDNGKAWMVTRREGAELVVMCFQGVNLRAWCRRLMDSAQPNGITSFRFHTTRRALARLVPFPVEYVETVFRVKVPDHGRE